jgi:hypothetical protein
MSNELFFLYDETENHKVRYVSFMGQNHRFDLAIVDTNRYYGKKLILDIQGGRFAIVGQDDLEEPGYLEHAYNLSEEDAAELRLFLEDIC